MKKRESQNPISSFILNRWSSRAMTGEEISDDELMALFEAARWAPSSYNNQPWRFVYAKRNSVHWDIFLNLLVPANQVWAKNAAVLVVVISRTTFEFNNKPSRTHSFDTGSALENLALQGSINGFVVHGMEGFDYDQARQKLTIPELYSIEAMFALGKYGNAQELPKKLQDVDFPNDRKPLSEIVFEGIFKSKD